MSFMELVLIAVGLSMDAFAVAICKGLSVQKLGWKHYLTVGVWFGGFQALMPTLGYLLVEAGDFEKALEFNRQAVDYDDEDPLALDNMGQTYYRLGGEEGKKEALKWFKKAVKFKPDAVDTNYFLALYDVDAGDYAAAREKLEICLEGRISPLNYATNERVKELLATLPQ